MSWHRIKAIGFWGAVLFLGLTALKLACNAGFIWIMIRDPGVR